MASKESQLMRMPSDLRGPDKRNPCVGCGYCRQGYCEEKKAWAHKVKHECVVEPIRARSGQKNSNKSIKPQRQRRGLRAGR